MQSLQFLKELFDLQEAASTITYATNRKLALFINDKGRTKDYILYDPAFFLKLLKKISTRDINFTGELSDPEGISGMIRVAPSNDTCWGASEVILAAAKKGFGPLLYDIVMSQEEWLMSDRTTVSPGADAVWKFYKERRPDVENLPFDNIDDPKTPPPEDDCVLHMDKDELNRAYHLKKNLNVAPLIQNHKSFVDKLSAEFDVNTLFLTRAAEELFDTLYF